MQPLDRFSGHASLYASYRIDYPAELYEYILAFVKNRDAAWDCATGNGQVATVLADVFDRVQATDISETQLAQAPQKPTIHYQQSPAEQTPFADHSFDLITVAQALHWFNVDAFHQEVRRVVKPGGILAEWGYGLVKLGLPELDALLFDFYRNRIGPYWDPQRRHIDEQYARLPFPFADVHHKAFTIHRSWSLERFLNYLRTWSAVRQYIHENEEDPVTPFGEQLRSHWQTDERTVEFPVFLRLGQVTPRPRNGGPA